MEANAASGTSGSYGGSSGGGIVLACRTLAGSGQVLAKGSRGNSNGGAGAGGRIALHLDAAAQADLGAQLPLLDVTGTTGAKWFHRDAMQDFTMGSIYFSVAPFLRYGWPVWKGWLHVPTNRADHRFRQHRDLRWRRQLRRLGRRRACGNVARGMLWRARPGGRAGQRRRGPYGRRRRPRLDRSQ
ncbi:MAG: hypothetical protein GX805_04065 [Gammaproteobacteria bacterium]|nr:hypothetical protein [Gammaproteobacteria bacterium]